MKLALRRKSKAERAIDAASDLAKLWAGAKLTKGTARAGGKAVKLKALTGSKTGRSAALGKALVSSQGRDATRKVLEAALAAKAVKGVAKRRRGGGRGPKLLALGGVAGAVAIALKARKGGSDQQAPA